MNLRSLLKKGTSSITVVIIPYNGLKSRYLKVPVIALLGSVALVLLGGSCLASLAINGIRYRAQQRALAEKAKYYSDQSSQLKSTLTALKQLEGRFQKLFSLKSRKEVLESADASALASLEMPNLAVNVKKTINTVAVMKDYLLLERDIYASTPAGYPVLGEISSSYGGREDPVSGADAFHPGIDIMCTPGTPVRATADGFVSYSGWKQGGGLVVVLDHGHGFSTVYAHNKAVEAKAGVKVRRGEIISYSGSTGKSTGPHVHYEVLKYGRTVDPRPYLFPRT